MSANARIDAKRLWQSLMDMAAIGATPRGGVCRIGLSEEDRQARDLFRSWCDAADYPVRVDRFGNMFARRPGRDPGLPAVLVGSHLDSQPTGGKFDGAYGVLAALEVLRSLDDMGLETLRPIEVVNWTNEEGAVFKPMIGSEVFTGALPLDKAYAMPDPQGRTLEEDLRAIGYAGDSDLRPDPLHCYFEVHIEQGPILERASTPIGVVTAGAGFRWYTLSLTGLESHAGPTPMDVRRDALVGAAEIVLAVREIALEQGEDGRGTVGCLTPYPASPNVIPGRVADVALCGALLIGMSTLQVEFDFGVPQFRSLFHPVLIALGSSLDSPLGTRTEHIEAWFAEMAASTGTTVEAVIKREAADPAAIRRMLEVEEVADSILFLVSRRASGLTGESIAVDGGLSRAGFL